MAEKGGVYVLDEPTSGLHLATSSSCSACSTGSSTPASR
jgi:ABC-type Na+ transport system ATPase subunit NatA